MVRLILVSTEFNWSGIVIENHGRAVSGMIRHHESPHTTVPYAVEDSSICLFVKEEGNARYLVFEGLLGALFNWSLFQYRCGCALGVSWYVGSEITLKTYQNTQWFQQLIDVT